MHSLAYKKIFVAIALAGLGAVFTIGCGPGAMPARPTPPDLPEPPKARYESLEEAVVTPVVLNSNRGGGDYNLSKTDAIAIMSFAQTGSAGSGALVADAIILELQRRGYKVIDRDQIEKIIKEQSRIGEGLTGLSDIEMAKKIGKLVSADYFLIGSVTEYASESRDIPLAKVIVQSDVERYQNEIMERNKKQTEWQNECDKANKKIKYNQEMGAHNQTLYDCKWVKAASIDEWQEKYYNENRKVYSPVARVGLTAKLINVSTTQILWVGQANISDTNLQRGMTRITSKMVDDFTGKKH